MTVAASAGTELSSFTVMRVLPWPLESSRRDVAVVWEGSRTAAITVLLGVKGKLRLDRDQYLARGQLVEDPGEAGCEVKMWGEEWGKSSRLASVGAGNEEGGVARHSQHDTEWLQEDKVR